MRVNSTNSNPIQNTEVSGPKKSEKTKQSSDAARAAAVAPGTVEGSTKTEISSRAKEMAKAKDVASSTPDVREEKIAELKKRIQAGRYQVDAEALADKMVDEHMRTAAAGLA